MMVAKGICLKVISLLSVLSLFPGLVLAQTPTGSILGTVRDQTGAVLPGVSITITNVETNISRTTISDDSGNYRVPSLFPGQYTIMAELSGFKKVIIEAVTLRVAQDLRQDIVLEVGEITEQVSVVAEAGLIQTDEATVGQVIDEKKILDLPLNGRNFLQLVTLSAGAAPVMTFKGGFTTGASGRPGLSYTISGQREVSNSYFIDGTEARSEWLQNASLLPSIDAIQEFRVQRSLFSAQFGTPAVVNIAIKSGGNSFHGTVYEFLRNDILDSSQFQDPVVGGKKLKPPFRMNQFGFSIGGPVIKNKTFAFGNYEGLRSSRAFTLRGFAIPEQLRRGDFSNFRDVSGRLIPIYDPASFNPAARTRQQFPGNIIPPTRLSQVAQNMLKFFPLPTDPTAPPGTINLVKLSGRESNFDQYTIRIDHKLSESSQMFGRYLFSDWSQLEPAFTEESRINKPLDSQNITIGLTHIFNPNWVNEFRFGYNRDRIGFLPAVQDRNFAQEVGLKNLSDIRSQFGLPLMSGITFSGIGAGTFTVFSQANLFQWNDILHIIKGRHNISTGFDIRNTKPWQLLVDSPSGRSWHTFNRLFTAQLDPQTGGTVPDTGSDIADFLLGWPQASNGAFGSTLTNFVGMAYNFFLQDDIKVTPKFTLNIGLRYEYQQQLKAKDDKISIFAPDLGRMVSPADGVRRGLVDPDFNNFAPRLGFAYQLSNDTVVRAGFGIYYDNTAGNEQQFKFIGHPKFQAQTLRNANPVPTWHLDALFPVPEISLSLTPFSMVREDRWPYVEQWNLNIQHKIGPGIAVEVGYFGSAGRKLSKRFDINQATPVEDPLRPTPQSQRRPYPSFGPILTSTKSANSSYNALQMRVEKTFSRGLFFLAAWTYSRSIDEDSSAGVATDTQNIFDRKSDRGLSGFHMKHRFVISYGYELPFGPRKRFLNAASGVLKKLVEGWQVNGITQLQSGTPFTVQVVGDHADVSFRSSPRAQRVGDCDGNLPGGQRTVDRWFDTSCFALPPPFRFGNVGRNTLIGPGFKSFDLNVFKNTYVTEDFYIQFRAEFFNVFNHSNYELPGFNVNAPLFGKILSERDPRIIQLGLKLIF